MTDDTIEAYTNQLHCRVKYAFGLYIEFSLKYFGDKRSLELTLGRGVAS